MAVDSTTAQAIIDHVIISSAADELKLITDAFRSLPEHAVKELISIGVCIRCIFRIFGVHECPYTSALLSQSLLVSIFGKGTDLEGVPMVCGSRADNDSNSLNSSQELEAETDTCSICLGILQFMYYDQQDVLMKRDCASDFASTIADVIKQDGHLIDNFSLEVSLPTIITENEESVRLHIKEKYFSELWYQKRDKSELISTKDVLKLSLTNPLETLLGIKSGLSSFRIRLTYTSLNASMNLETTAERNRRNKRRKTEDGNGSNCRPKSGAIDSSNLCSSEGLQDQKITDGLSEKVNRPCHLTFLCSRTPIYIGGRYLKYSRNVSQSRWIIDDERMGDTSVEEIIGGNILPTCRGDIYKFHAAGREDIDVRMLGSGRPFLIEIQNARHVPSEASINDTERIINSLESKLVMVKNLKVLGSEAWDLMREGEAEKQKQYAALVWISRPLTDDDSQIISSFKDMQIMQKTPVRVLHRRSPLGREKIIHWMKIERIAASSQYFLLHLCTQAGTYIKEFVHGDLGRTNPSLGSILGCRAEILQLDVTDVKMDCLLPV